MAEMLSKPPLNTNLAPGEWISDSNKLLRKSSMFRGIWISFWLWDAEIAANLVGQNIHDFCMSGNGGAPILLRIMPPRVPGAFSH